MWFIEFWQYVVALCYATVDGANDMSVYWKNQIPGGASGYAMQLAGAIAALPHGTAMLVLQLMNILDQLQQDPAGASTPLISLIMAIFGLFSGQL